MSVKKQIRETITLTFGDQGENHVGMEKIGKIAENGFNIEDINKIKTLLDGMGVKTELFNLCELVNELPIGAPELAPAYVLVIRGFLRKDRADKVLTENKAFDWDKKLWNSRQKKVQNKIARHNVLYSENSQEADFENGKGTIISYKQVPLLDEIRRALYVLLGEKAQDLICEGNRYYDVSKTGIGWHGDTERKRVFGVRLGESMPLAFRWWFNNKSFGNTLTINLEHGDAYIMSEKAVGWDWKNSVRYGATLRHSAGCNKYTSVKK